jgi:hypothetical protein
MNVFIAFLIGTISSLTAMVIAFYVFRWRWPRFLGWISGSQIFRHGVEYCYSSQAAAKVDMIRHFGVSNNIRVMCMRAFSVTQPEYPFPFLLEDKMKNIRFLLADPGDNLGDNPLIADCAKDYGSGITTESYRNSIQISLRAIKNAMSTRRNVQCKVHSLPRIVRMFLCDDYGFISFFKPGVCGTELPVLAVRRSSPFYGAMSKMFDLVWEEKSRDLKEVKNLQ